MEITNDKIIFGFILTLIAGLSTGFGSCLAFFSHHSNKKFLAFTLGLSGGVMVYISLVELLADANRQFAEAYGKQGSLVGSAAFFGGMLVAMIIDRLVPSYENPHEVRRVEEMDHKNKRKLMRGGLLFALAIGVHNFPEGMATFSAALTNPTTGISIAAAIAIHNIPEGITVSVPIYFATGSRRKAFYYSFLSGLAEPVGAVIAWAFLMPFITPLFLAGLFAAVSGVMVFISFDELIPLAEQYGEHHLTIYGLIAGMFIMAAVLAMT